MKEMKETSPVLPEYDAAYDYVYNYLGLTPAKWDAKKIDGYPMIVFTCQCGTEVYTWEENGEVYGEY